MIEGCNHTIRLPTKGTPRSSASLATFAGLLFVLLAVQWTFTLTPPSDPLEYVGPAFAPDAGFPYLDRVALWLWLRAFTLLPLPPELVGPVATLVQTTLILWLGVYWLSRNVAMLAGGLFGGLYMLSPMVLGIATHTYPIQLMTLVLLGVAFLNAGQPTPRGTFWTGVGVGLALLSKVQAGGVALLLLIRIFFLPHKVRWLALLALGGSAAWAGMAILLMFLDGPGQPARIISAFFVGGAGETQFTGLATGGIPPFQYYLAEPTVVLAIAGALLPWFCPVARQVRVFALFAIGQTLFLVAIYVITQRGGALISNYSFDAVVFGLIGFSGVAGGLAARQVARPVPFLVTAACFISVAAISRFENTPAQFYPQSLPTLLAGTGIAGLDYLFVVPAIAVAFWGVCRKLKFWEKTSSAVLALAFSAIMILAVLYSGKGPAYGAYHRDWSLPYHQLAHEIMTETDQVCLDIRLGNATADIANWRMDWLLRALYRRPQSFIGEVTGACRIIYSDQVATYGSARDRPELSPGGPFRYEMVRLDLRTSERRYFTIGR